MTFFIFVIQRRYKTLILIVCWVLCRSSAERSYLESIKKKKSSINSNHEYLLESYLHKSSAKKEFMIHEKIASKKKQSVEQESSNRSMKEIRRESIISTNEIKDEFDAIWTSYHIQNFSQLKYWLKKNEVSIATTWINMRDEHVAFFNQLNKKINEMSELTKTYNTQTDKLHDVIFIIRELKIE